MWILYAHLYSPCSRDTHSFIFQHSITACLYSYSKPYIVASLHPNCTLERFSCLFTHGTYSPLCGTHNLLPFLSSGSPFVLSATITSHRHCYCILHCICITNPPPSSSWHPCQVNFSGTPEA